MVSDDPTDAFSRRRFLITGSAATTVALAGCIGGGDDSNGDSGGNGDSASQNGDASENGDGGDNSGAGENGGSSENGGDDGDEGATTGDDSETFEVGHGEYRTTISREDFPDDQLVAYAVQTGWSNWGSVMEAFEAEYGITLDDNQGSSGEKLRDARANAQNPQASIFNGGYSFAIQAMNDGLTTDYKPKGWDKVPDELKTDNGHCTATRRMTTAVTYRRDVYDERGLDAPETWEDLKPPDIAQDLAFTPPHTANGLASALSVNRAYGGNMDNVDPLIEYHEAIAEHGADFRRNIEGDVTGGEISTVVEYDYSGLNMKYNVDELDEEQIDVAIVTGPNGEDGAMNVPYGYAPLANAPNPEAAKLFMDFVLELDTQALFFDAFVRPIRASELDAPDQFPDQSAYDAAQFAIDTEQLVANQEDVIAEIQDRTPLPGAQ
ncbi:sulfate ABC transporter substrate-binding protein [Halobacteriales archaeon QH_2_66_30]|nr:MAG: sulfate ABC transporter substrate-binding protein [Halobacteriales archaeon QH_2_66_30]